MITIKRLETPLAIEDACSLPYKIYMQLQKWDFDVNNPSKIRVEIRNNRLLLVDRFTERATWIGAFDDKKLVGCIRLFGVDETGKLEVETYASSAPILPILSKFDRKKCFEISKLAVSEDFVGHGIEKKLLLACFRIAEENETSLLTFTHNGYLKSLYRKIEFPLQAEQTFKYEPQDTSAVNFYFADQQRCEISEILSRLEYLEHDLSNNSRNIFKALQTVEPILPTPFYWMNAQGVVLGINELCLKAIGTTREIIGKRPYEFYKKEFADHILKHNSEVIRKQEVLSQEEWIEDITTKERKCFSAIKAPLYDDDGTIIGIVGTSIEITAQKEAEKLKLERQRQEALQEAALHEVALLEKEKFVELARRVAHDISSPLAALKMMMTVCNELPEDKRSMMNKGIESILDIANNLLTTYKGGEQPTVMVGEDRVPVLISDLLVHLLSEKKVEYAIRAIHFRMNVSDEAQFAFAALQPSQFRRAMSNLINNAVDAIESKIDGIVSIALHADQHAVRIAVEDNGKGLSETTIKKILSRSSFSEGKPNGNGIGLQQIWDLLDNNEGTMSIESTPGSGSLFRLDFPRIESASWIAREIHLGSDSIIVILDDDESIHGAWDARFDSYLKAHHAMRLHHFTHGAATLEFFSQADSVKRERIVFLCDFVLLRQKKNGLQIIRESKIAKSTLVTSHYDNAEIRNRASELDIKILPKQLASVVPIQFDH